VPSYIGQRINDAGVGTTWNADPASGTRQKGTGNGNFTIGSQNPSAGTSVACSTNITLSE